MIGSASLAMYPDPKEALLEAAQEGNVDFVRTLLDAGVPVNTQDYYLGYTSLNSASQFGYKYVCQLLLERNAQVDIKNNSGWTPLMNAAYHGHKKICTMLLNHNAQINSQNKHGLTPLMLAAARWHQNICRLLIDEMLKPIKQKINIIIMILGCNRKRQGNLLSLLPRDIAKIIAHQLYQFVKEEKQHLFEQIHPTRDKSLRTYLCKYYRQQLRDRSVKNEEKSAEPNHKRSKIDDNE